MGPAVIRGLKPTAKINCRYATDKLSSTGDTDGQNPLFDGNPNPRASAKCPHLCFGRMTVDWTQRGLKSTP